MKLLIPTMLYSVYAFITAEMGVLQPDRGFGNAWEVDICVGKVKISGMKPFGKDFTF